MTIILMILTINPLLQKLGINIIFKTKYKQQKTQPKLFFKEIQIACTSISDVAEYVTGHWLVYTCAPVTQGILVALLLPSYFRFVTYYPNL